MPTFNDLWLASPAILLFFGALVIMLAEAVVRPASKSGFWALALGTLVGAGALTASLFGGAGVDGFGGMLRVDKFGLFAQLICVLAGVLSVLFSHDYLERLQLRVGEYYALVLFGVCGMGLMCQANDLIMIFVALEVMSISMYILCALKRGDPRSVEAGFKYFILGAFSSGLMLYGISFLYGGTGTTSLPGIGGFFMGQHQGTEGTLVAIGGALLIVGFGFKVASVPFHMWTPDVYQGAPISVTALMSSGVKAASFAAFARFVFGVVGSHSAGFEGVLWWMAAATMVVGNLGALAQRDLKRMLAYSSIAHAGYLLMALVAAADGTAVANGALASLLFYLLAYTFMNAGAFVVLAAFTREGEDHTDIDSLAGLGKSNPWLAAGLSLCLLSMAGIPPTMGFVGKFYLFSAAIQSGEIPLAIIGALSAAAGVYYYLRPMVWMYMKEGHGHARVTPVALTGLAISGFALLALGLVPGPVLALAEESLKSLFV